MGCCASAPKDDKAGGKGTKKGNQNTNADGTPVTKIEPHIPIPENRMPRLTISTELIEDGNEIIEEARSDLQSPRPAGAGNPSRRNSSDAPLPGASQGTGGGATQATASSDVSVSLATNNAGSASAGTTVSATAQPADAGQPAAAPAVEMQPPQPAAAQPPAS